MAERIPYRATSTSTMSRALRWSPHVGFVLFFVFLLIRLPFLSEYPVNWDSVQYLLGIDLFDIERHQPHPPGYVGYIMLGRAAQAILGSAHFALVLLSVLGGAIATVAMYGLARCWLDRRYAVMTAVLFGTSPLVWYYSGVALNYMVEVAVVIPLVWMCYRARADQSWRDLLIATLLLSVLGSLRQSGFVLLAPLWLYTAWAFPWRQRIKSATALGTTVLLWAVPLLWLAGGPVKYLEESRALGALVSSEPTLTSKLQEYAGYLGQVVLALGLGLMAALVILIGYRSTSRHVLGSLTRHDWWFFGLWAIPSIATFVFGHFGQLGYILTILPIAFLWVGAVLSRLGPVLGASRYATPSVAVTAIVLVNTLAFIALPDVATRVTRSGILEDAEKAPITVRQYDTGTSDAYWDELISDVQSFPTDSTAVLTTVGGPRVSGGYRHLSYYLPDYNIYGLGRDQYDVFGHMFLTIDGNSNYSVAGLHNAQRIIPLPENVRYIVTPEPEIIDRIHESLEPHEIEGSDLVYFFRPEGMNLAILPGDEMVACNCPGMMIATQLAQPDQDRNDVTGS